MAVQECVYDDDLIRRGAKINPIINACLARISENTRRLHIFVFSFKIGLFGYNLLNERATSRSTLHSATRLATTSSGTRNYFDNKHDIEPCPGIMTTIRIHGILFVLHDRKESSPSTGSSPGALRYLRIHSLTGKKYNLFIEVGVLYRKGNS